MPKGKYIYKPARWTKQEESFLLEHYIKRGPAWCAEALSAMGYQRTRAAVDGKGFSMGLRYIGPPMGRFKKGLTPPNKGKKMPTHVYERAKATMFKKGNRTGAANNNYKPIGAEVFRQDEYWWVKVAEKKWVLKHRLLWEQHYGQIPPGHLVRFRDGNPHNFDKDNLELITRAQHATRNRHGAGPSEYSLLSGRAARIRLKKRGIGFRASRENPEIFLLAQAETLLLNKKRKQHARTQD